MVGVLDLASGALPSNGDTDNPLAQMAAQFPGNAAPGGTSPLEQPPVWMGDTTTTGIPRMGGAAADPDDRDTMGTEGSLDSVPESVDLSKALNLPYQWSEKKRRQVMERINSTGEYEVYTFADLVGAWESIVGMASDSWIATDGNNPMTPWDVIDSMKRDAQHFGLVDGNGNPIDGSGPEEPKWQGEVDEDGNWISRKKTKTVDEIGDGDAWSLMQQAAQAALGREATDNEVRRFAYKANKIAAENPSITKTKTVIDPEGDQGSPQVVETDTNTSGGFGSGDAQKLASEMNETPEAGAYQASTTYYNAFLAALDSVV